MESKVCSRSQGHPPGPRRRAIMETARSKRSPVVGTGANTLPEKTGLGQRRLYFASVLIYCTGFLRELCDFLGKLCGLGLCLIGRKIKLFHRKDRKEKPQRSKSPELSGLNLHHHQYFPRWIHKGTLPHESPRMSRRYRLQSAHARWEIQPPGFGVGGSRFFQRRAG